MGWEKDTNVRDVGGTWFVAGAGWEWFCVWWWLRFKGEVIPLLLRFCVLVCLYLVYDRLRLCQLSPGYFWACYAAFLVRVEFFCCDYVQGKYHIAWEEAQRTGGTLVAGAWTGWAALSIF